MTPRKQGRLPQWPPRLPGVTQWFRWSAMARLVLALLTTTALTALVFLHLDYYQIGSRLEQFRSGQPAPRDIIAPRPLSWTDQLATERARDESARQVPIQYVEDAKANFSAEEDVRQIFDILTAPELSAADQAVLNDLKLPQAIQQSARSLDRATLSRLQTSTEKILAEVMSGRIEEDHTEQQAYHLVEVKAGIRETDPAHARVVSSVTRLVLRPNWVIDEVRTEKLRQQARIDVKPITVSYKRGEVVLRKGETLKPFDLNQLQAKNVLVPAPLVRLIPIAALMLFAIAVLWVYLRNFCQRIYGNLRKMILLSCLIVAPLWAMMTLGAEQEYLVGLLAITAGSMAVAGLLGVPVAVVTTMLISVIAGLTADHQYTLVLLTLGSALTGVMVVSAIWPAHRAAQAVAALVLVNLGLLLIVEAIQPGNGLGSLWQDGFWTKFGQLALWATAGGIGATFIAVGAIYILARPFGITTHYRLMELSNPNEPLLRRMMIEAPGTYHSSVMVANMAEAAADAIGADALLTRVAALYHDIGKLKRPAFFVENQAPLGIENVHQRLSPKLSFLILVSHVRDGVETGRQYQLPDEVVNVIREHHGTTLAAYFYHRAVNDTNGEQVQEHDFRYPGPRPSTREAAVVMLSDSVQATVKSLKDPTPSRIEHMVQEIINNRLNDGQLEDCDITLSDLRRIRDVFLRILTGLYTYTRIEYPDIKGEGTRTRANFNSEPAAPAGEHTLPASSH